MDYLSDTNLRAVLTVLVARAGGSVEITNEELYDAMMPDRGGGEPFRLTQTGKGVLVTVRASPPARA
jgi:hypothetical protein